MLLHGIATSTEMMNVTNLRTRVHEPTNSAFTTTSPQSQTQKSDIRRMVGPAALLQPTEKKGGLFSRRHSMGQVSSLLSCASRFVHCHHISTDKMNIHRIPYLEVIRRIKTTHKILVLFRTSIKYSIKLEYRIQQHLWELCSR